MPLNRIRVERRPSSRRWILALLTVGVTCALLIASSLFAPGEVSDRQGARDAEASAAVPDVALAGDDYGEGSQAFYPYSVVPGGVHSPEALVAAVEDPVVADHYAAVDIARTRVVTVAAARRAYVSYRIGDHVFWTKHTVALHPGEQVLTDGRSEIRARCGNRISDTPQDPTSPQEPEAAEFDRAVVPMDDDTPVLLGLSNPDGSLPGADGLPLGGSPLMGGGSPLMGGGAMMTAPFDAEPGGGVLGVEHIPLGGLLTGDRDGGLLALNPDESHALIPEGPFQSLVPSDSPLPVTPVPEPGSVLLVATGLAGGALRAWRRRRKAR